jgi:hypothetical protein
MTETIEQETTFNPDLMTSLLIWAGQEVTHTEALFKSLGWPEWGQGSWAERSACGTSCCIAGNAVYQAKDWVLDIDFEDQSAGPDAETWQRRPFSGHSKYATYAIPITVTGVITEGPDKGKPTYVYDHTRSNTEIRYLASDILGIDEKEAWALFDQDNDLSDLVFLGKTIASIHGHTLDLPPELEDLLDENGSRWSFDGDAPAGDVRFSVEHY